MKRIFLYVIILLLTAVTLESKATAVEFVIPASTNGAFADLLAGTKLLRENGVTLYESTANILELRFKMIKTVNGERRSFCTKKGDRFLFDSGNIFFESNGMILMTYAIKTKEAVFEADSETFKFRATNTMPILTKTTPAKKPVLVSIKPATTNTTATTVTQPTYIPTPGAILTDTFNFETLSPEFSFTSFLEELGRKKNVTYTMSDGAVQRYLDEYHAKEHGISLREYYARNKLPITSAREAVPDVRVLQDDQ